MLKVLGSPRRACDGITRRESLQFTAAGLLGGLGLPQILQADETRRRNRPGRAKSVILLYLLGGAATQDMIDLKPSGPADIRGEFRPISTSVPGIQVCEHIDRKSTRLNSSHIQKSRMPSSA